MNATMVNTNPTLAALFHEAMIRHDIADAAFDEDGVDVNSAIVDLIAVHAGLTPCRDLADVAHRISAAIGIAGRICNDAKCGQSVDDSTLLVESLLGTALDGLEDFTGFRRENYRLDFYATRRARTEQPTP